MTAIPCVVHWTEFEGDLDLGALPWSRRMRPLEAGAALSEAFRSVRDLSEEGPVHMGVLWRIFSTGKVKVAVHLVAVPGGAGPSPEGRGPSRRPGRVVDATFPEADVLEVMGS